MGAGLNWRRAMIKDRAIRDLVVFSLLVNERWEERAD